MRDLLEHLYDKYNREEFIEADPISVPHSFSRTEDREIAGFFASTIAWGNRKAIVRSAHRMMDYMDNAPYDFVCNATETDLQRLHTYVHRTFNGRDFADFVRAVQGVCRKWGSLGEMFQSLYERSGNMATVLSEARKEFFSAEHDPHCEKHFSSIDKGAACKRLNMYLRWFVRRDGRGGNRGGRGPRREGGRGYGKGPRNSSVPGREFASAPRDPEAKPQAPARSTRIDDSDDFEMFGKIEL